MKLPTWALIVGICMLLFGGCHTSNRIGEIAMTSSGTLDSLNTESKTGFAKVKSEMDSLEQSETASDEEKQDAKMFNIFMSAGGDGDELFPNEYESKWMIRFGYIGAIIGLIYALTGLLLLMKKPIGYKLLLPAIGLMIAYLVAKIVIFNNQESKSVVVGLSMFGMYLSIFIDTILALIVITGDKSAFERPA